MRHSALRLDQGCRYLPTLAVEERGPERGVGPTVRLSQLLSARQGFVTLLHGLVGIAETPEEKGQTAETDHLRVVRIEGEVNSPTFGVVVRECVP